MSTYLIVGSGISGMTAALALARGGHTVEVLDRAGLTGGKVLEYCCKATDSCVRCGVCVAHTELSCALADPRITIHTGISLDAVSNSGTRVSAQVTQRLPAVDHGVCVGCGACVTACPEGCITEYARAELVQYGVDHERCRLHNGQSCSACVDACPVGAVAAGAASRKKTISGEAVLVATGHEPFDPTVKPRYAYGRSTNVLTGAELEKILSHEDDLGDPQASIAFIQCVGSRDPVLGRNYCSAVCCAYALRLARVLKSRNPQGDLTVYYIDLQNFDKEFGGLRNELEELGVRFVRGLPFRVDEQADGRLRLMGEDAEGSTRTAVHDKVVLSVGLGPAEGARRIAGRLGLVEDEFGFFSSSADNVFVSGTCREPQSIPDSMAAARDVAARMQRRRVDAEA